MGKIFDHGQIFLLGEGVYGSSGVKCEEMTVPVERNGANWAGNERVSKENKKKVRGENEIR